MQSRGKCPVIIKENNKENAFKLYPLEIPPAFAIAVPFIAFTNVEYF